MTARTKPNSRRPGLSAADYPALEAFFGGYLHEDFVEEHGSPAGARRAFRADADESDLVQFGREASRLLAAVKSLPFHAVAEFVRRDLGSAWSPGSLEDLRKVLGVPRQRAGKGAE